MAHVGYLGLGMTEERHSDSMRVAVPKGAEGL